MNKKGGLAPLLWTLVIGFLAISGFLVYTSFSAPATGTGGEIVATETGTVAGATCPDTLKALTFRAIDTEAIPAVQIGGDVFLYDKSSTQIGNVSLSATSGTWSNHYHGCVLDGTAVLPTLRGKYGGNTSATEKFSIAFNDVQAPPLSIKEIAPLQIRVKDLDTDSYMYIFNAMEVSVNQTNQSTYTDLNSSEAYATQDQNPDNKSVSTSGVLNLKVYAKAKTARRYFGDPALKTYLCVDTGTASHWSAPTVSIGGGTPLADVKGTLGANNNGNDGRYSYIASSEYCYEIGAFTNAERTIDVSIPAVGGVDPDGADDIVMYFLPQGVFRSVKSATLNQPLTGVVTDASTQVLVATPSVYVPKLTIPIE